MTGRAVKMDARLRMPGSTRNTYLSFLFAEKDKGMELEFVGRVELKPQPDKPDCIVGCVNPWGCDIPVIDLRILCGRGSTQMIPTSCIIIFEHFESYRYYFGMVVEDVSNVVNIADGSENAVSPLLMSAKRHLSLAPAMKN